MDVVIQLSGDRTSTNSAGPVEHHLTAVRGAIGELGLELKPVHPGTQDPTLSTYFYVRVPDPQTAARVIDVVRQMPSVSAAYVKPPDEPP